MEPSNLVQINTETGLKTVNRALTNVLTFLASPFQAAAGAGFGLGTAAVQQAGQGIQAAGEGVVKEAKNFGLWVVIVLFLVFAIFSVAKSK